MDTDNDIRRVNQEIVSWNTEDSSTINQRFEKIGTHTELKLISGSWKLQEIYRGMTRFMKSNENYYEYWKYNFNSRWNESTLTYKQHLGSQQFTVSDAVNKKVCASENSVGVNNIDEFYILNHVDYDGMRNASPKIGSDGNDIYFNFSDAWEDPTYYTCPTSFYDISTVGADKFQDTIDFKLESLNSTAFSDKFRTNFMTTP